MKLIDIVSFMYYLGSFLRWRFHYPSQRAVKSSGGEDAMSPPTLDMIDMVIQTPRTIAVKVGDYGGIHKHIPQHKEAYITVEAVDFQGFITDLKTKILALVERQGDRAEDKKKMNIGNLAVLIQYPGGHPGSTGDSRLKHLFRHWYGLDVPNNWYDIMGPDDGMDLYDMDQHGQHRAVVVCIMPLSREDADKLAREVIQFNPPEVLRQVPEEKRSSWTIQVYHRGPPTFHWE